ncbi:MAG: hypothetical protein ACXW61_16675 [Gemmatirosa sp.]
MRDDEQQNDKSQYVNDGFRDRDGREGFGDDMGTRVGRPDGAREARQAPEDAQRGESEAGQPSTNSEPVSNGIEGSLTGDEHEGPQQSWVRASTQQRPDGSARAGDDDSRIDDL